MATKNNTARKAAALEALRNSKNDIASLWDSIVKGTKESANQQAQITLYLHDNAAAYGDEFYAQYAKKEGKEKVTMIDTYLVNQSPTIAKIIADIDRNKDKDSQISKKARTLMNESLANQLKAARQMFRRAVAAAYFLRTVGATGVSIRSDGSFDARYASPGVKDALPDNQQVSNTHCAKFGDAALLKLAGKSKPDRSDQDNKNKDKMKVTEDALKAAAGRMLVTGINEKLSEKAQADADVLLVSILRRYFGNEKTGAIDPKAITRYVTEHKLDQPEKAMTAAQSEGVTKGKHGVSLATSVPPTAQSTGQVSPAQAAPNATKPEEIKSTPAAAKSAPRGATKRSK